MNQSNQHIKLKKASIEQQPILANLLELYAYDFTEFHDFDIGDDGFYGYEYLPLYWTEEHRYPYLVTVNDKIAGFVLLQQGCPFSNNPAIWDIAEFFIMRKYQRKGIGTKVALKLFSQNQGEWQVRVLAENKNGNAFWHATIKKFTHKKPVKSTQVIKNEKWYIFNFASKRDFDNIKSYE